jgi:hypothetical protein
MTKLVRSLVEQIKHLKRLRLRRKLNYPRTTVDDIAIDAINTEINRLSRVSNGRRKAYEHIESKGK